MAYIYLHPDSTFIHPTTHPHYALYPNPHQHWSDTIYDTIRFANLGMLPIAPGEERIVAHGVPIDMSDYGPYILKVITYQPGDQNALDDFFQSYITHPIPEDLPYIVDFEPLPKNQVLSFGNGWYTGSFGGFQWQTDDVDIELATGPTYDHTKENANGMFLVTVPQEPTPMPWPPSGMNEEAIVITPCVELPDVAHAFMEFYYHRYGNDLSLGSMKVDIFDDEKWIEIFRVNGQTQISKMDDWDRAKRDLQQ